MTHDHAHGHTHADLLAELEAQLQPLLESSEQAMYVYFDDELKFCNGKFASLLGYASPEEWARTEGSFPSVFVAESSRHALIGAFQKAMQAKAASTTKITWTTASGGTAETTVILVPLSYKGHLFALHFVE